MWNLLKLAEYWKSAANGTRSRRKKTSGNRRSRSRLTRVRGFEQLENRSLLSAMPTWTALAASANAVDYGQTVALTATVKAGSPNPATPTGGTVTFLDGGTALGSAPLNDGTAAINIALSPGQHMVTAVYNGDGTNFAASTACGTVSTIAGDGSPGYAGDNDQATNAEMNVVPKAVLDNAGHLFISDFYNNRIRELDLSSGVITTIAGNGIQGFSGDNGQATAAEMCHPAGIALDNSGHLFIADLGNNRIRELNLSTGVITTIAGDGTEGFSGDNGPAIAAELNQPQDVAVDNAGHLFIADWLNSRVRDVNLSSGTITTVAGGATEGYSGDNGQATAAELSYPDGVAVDNAGRLIIADAGNSRVREVNLSTGVISTIAGNGTEGSSGDNGPATQAELNGPSFMATDTAGDLFIGDFGSQRIREVNFSTGLISTVAGNGTGGYSGDNGPALDAEFCNPGCGAVDSAGNLYIADCLNNCVRVVTPGDVPISVSKATPQFSDCLGGGTYNGSPFSAVAPIFDVNGVGHTALEGVPITYVYYAASSVSGRGTSVRAHGRRILHGGGFLCRQCRLRGSPRFRIYSHHRQGHAYRQGQ